MILVGSDFSGVGAFDQALRRLKIDYKTVFACDIDKYARQTYVANYGEPEYYPEDVYDREIPKTPLDVYMTSPPCQAFSLAGSRKGENDERGVLFYNSHEFIAKNKPRYFIFENVKGLLSDSSGRTFQVWLDMLGGKSVNGNPVLFPREDATPYHIYYKVLNAKHYGVPQNRERVFIVGIRDDEDNLFRWPKEIPLEKRLKDVLEDQVDEKYFLRDATINLLTSHSEKMQERGNGFCFKPTDGGSVASAVTSRVFKMGVDDNYIDCTGSCYDQPKVVLTLEGSRDQSNRVYGGGGISPTIHTAQGGGQHPKTLVGQRIRRLTPRECFRLMDFPEDFIMPCSDTQMYKQAGNSIVVAVLAAIIIKLKSKCFKNQ